MSDVELKAAFADLIKYEIWRAIVFMDTDFDFTPLRGVFE